MDLKKLDVDELATLQADIQAELVRKEQAQKQEVIEQVRALLAEHGMSFDDLPGRGGRARASKGKVPPKYRNPQDPGKTWSGRGRKPRWVEAHLKSGGKLKDLAI